MSDATPNSTIEMPNKTVIVALDGPAASGKSTVSGLLANRLGFAHLDTGAMYRVVAYEALRTGADVHDADAVTAIAHDLDIELDGARVFSNGVDVSTEIRTKAVSEAVSVIAVHSGVRAVMRDLQRAWAAKYPGIVAEGRDIGTVVFPHAQVKVFLTASPLVRARRRVGERTNEDIDAIAAEIAERDERDANRADSPMKPAPGGVVLDTSDLTIDQVLDELATLVAAAS